MPTANGCAVFLGNEDKTFVIYVDHSVGNAISMTLNGVKKERPLTHDLIGSILLGLSITLERIVINDVSDGTFLCAHHPAHAERTRPQDHRGRRPPERFHRARPPAEEADFRRAQGLRRRRGHDRDPGARPQAAGRRGGGKRRTTRRRTRSPDRIPGRAGKTKACRPALAAAMRASDAPRPPIPIAMLTGTESIRHPGPEPGDRAVCPRQSSPGLPLTALAPMQDVTDLAFMQRHRPLRARPTYFFTEFFRVHAQSRPEKHILRSITENATGRPVFAQLIGESVPDILRTVRELLAYPVAGIDLNLGCPAPKIYRKNVGGGLLRDPARIDEILGALRAAVPGLLTVKMRVGLRRYRRLRPHPRTHQPARSRPAHRPRAHGEGDVSRRSALRSHRARRRSRSVAPSWPMATSPQPTARRPSWPAPAPPAS